MSRPPFRKGVNPLFRAGLVENVSDPLVQFLWFCEGLYLDNLLLRQALIRAGVNAEEVLGAKRPAGTTPGSPGPHRKAFDPWYQKIGTNWQVQRAVQANKGRSSKTKPN